MDFVELVSLAFQALRSNVLRTLLTMLGIIIGIASVIIIMSLGEGATASIVEQISAFGANNLNISPGSFQRGPVRGGGVVTTLTREDAEVIEELVANVAAVSAQVSGHFQVVAEEENTSATVTGADEAYQVVNNLTILAGSWLNDSQVNGGSRVVVLGDEMVIDLFGEDSEEYVLGQSVKIDSRPFRIIGVAQDSNAVLVPITTAMSILEGRDYVDGITVMVKEAGQVDAAELEIEELLMNRHEVSEADFSIRSAQEMISTVSTITGTMTTMLSAIAAISLVVGGIGIMNIMLVTVTERTKEIGLLKAIGAKRRDILIQFLIEAVALTLAGGSVGIIIGLGVTGVAANLLDIPFVLSYKAMALAAGVSAGVGVVFGFYPAQRAARLNPIDALRYE
jgi:ABC-type antimicrobial peptide transport system permease subunit